MCGRITLTTPDVEEIARLIDARIEPGASDDWKPRYNGAPTDRLWIVTPARALGRAVWGFPAESGVLINARSESAARLAAFRDAFSQRRVVVPADGFYEWKGGKGARRPVWFRRREGRYLWMAGLARDLPDGRTAFVVLTTEANGPIAELHDRMPALLLRDQIGAWLSRPDSGLLVPAPPDFLTATEVSPRVNDVKNDDPSLLDPPAPPPPARQLTLF